MPRQLGHALSSEALDGDFHQKASATRLLRPDVRAFVGRLLLVIGPASLVNTNWQAEAKFLPAIMMMLAGPSIAGLLLTGLVDGRAGYRDLFLRLSRWRVAVRWYVLAILPAPIVSAAILFTLSLRAPLFTADDKAAVFSAVWAQR